MREWLSAVLRAVASLLRPGQVTSPAAGPQESWGSGAADVTSPAADGNGRKIAGVPLEPLLGAHRVFDATALWHLAHDGLSVNGRVQGTVGEPATARRAFDFFGAEFRAAAREFSVPIELLVACACAEAGVHIRQGREAACRSERREPGFISYAATPHRVSIGVMHTLLSTARGALGYPGLMAEDLCDPRVSIRAGAAYIASQRFQTRWDPPLVGAAYNAGGVYDDPVPGLPFSLRDFPAGEDRHVERFCLYFNDVWRLVLADRGLAAGAPSLVREIAV